MQTFQCHRCSGGWLRQHNRPWPNELDNICTDLGNRLYSLLSEQKIKPVDGREVVLAGHCISIPADIVKSTTTSTTETSAANTDTVTLLPRPLFPLNLVGHLNNGKILNTCFPYLFPFGPSKSPNQTFYVLLQVLVRPLSTIISGVAVSQEQLLPEPNFPFHILLTEFQLKK